MTQTQKKWSQRSEDRKINRAIIEEAIKRKHCTLLTNKNFHCEKLKGHTLKKGEEKCCHSPEFLNCPAYNQYLNYESIRKHKKQLIK